MPIGNNQRILDCDDGSRPAPVFNLAKSINFDYLNDSNNAEVEADDKSIVADNSLQFARTPCRSVEKAQFWDSGLGSPTPGSSPVTASKSTRNFTVTLSPIPFSYEDSEETNEAMLDSSITGQENSAPQRIWVLFFTAKLQAGIQILLHVEHNYRRIIWALNCTEVWRKWS